MKIEEFEPCNALEEALIKGIDGRMPVEEVLACLLNANVYVPSGSVALADGKGMRPLLFDKDDSSFVAVFSDKTRVTPFLDKAPYCLMVKGRDLVDAISQESGIVVNPGWSVGMEVTAEGLQNVRRCFAVES